MDFKSTNDYIDIVNKLAAIDNIPRDVIGFLNSYIMKIYRSDEESKYSKPMLWIGLYIALASLICIFAMVGDLLHGLRTRKLWFPCKYFTINSASLTVIAVAMKLPVDLTTSMPGDVDQLAKLGSMAFMCSMMANLLPSLATMNSKELTTNTVALVVLVITFVVNICIQIVTGVVSYEEKVKINKIVKRDLDSKSLGTYENFNKITATIYATLLLMLLFIHICSSLAILESKQIIESKYQDHARDLAGRHVTLEGIRQHVSKYWIMEGTRTPQFIRVCSVTTSASGVICVLSTIWHIFTVLKTSPKLKSKYCESDYQWSMSVILIIQFIGVIVGTIAPLCRCFAALSFKMSIKQSWNNVFKIESYWIRKLLDWKHSTPIPIHFRSSKCKFVIENLKSIILSFLIILLKAVVVMCKMISLIPFFFKMCVFFMCGFLGRVGSGQFCLPLMMCRASSAGSGKNTHQWGNSKDLWQYVLQLDGELEPHKKTLMKSILESVNGFFQNAEKPQPSNLMRLLKKSSGFEGVEKFDNDCWSLPVVTLTAIVVSLPNTEKDIAEEFLESVSEALTYVTLVEQSLNAIRGYVSIQKAAEKLWLELDVYNKWLGYKLKDFSSKKNIRQILEQFRETSKNIVTEVESTESGWPNDDSICRSICANSMHRITETIMDSYKDNIDQVSEEDLFTELSSMISAIVAACLTNLPQVIALQLRVIEKREPDFHAAAKLLGETSEIINVLQNRELPSLNPDDFPFIHMWRDFLRVPNNFRS